MFDNNFLTNNEINQHICEPKPSRNMITIALNWELHRSDSCLKYCSLVQFAD